MQKVIKLEDKSKGEIVIDLNAKPFTPEVAVQCVFGMSLKEFAKDIRENKGGKYNSLYI